MNPKYEKMEGEDLYEYGLRLIEIKVEQKPEDLDWQDIVEATGIDCHRDSLRKAASVTPYSGYAVAQHFKKKPYKTDYAEELNLKMIEMRKEAKRFQDQRREFNKMVDKIGRSENLEDSLLEAATKLNEFAPLRIDKSDTMDGNSEGVLVFADWHYGMTADNVWNKYDIDICKQRVAKVVSMAKERLEYHGCGRLNVILLGDMAHGAIHTSARVASEELACNQIMQVSELLAEAISELANSVGEVYVYSTYGNHLRTVQNKKDSIHADNMERLIPWWLEQRLSQRGDILFPDADYYEFLYFQAAGYNICASHGDLDGVKSAGRTINTIFNKKYGCSIDYVLLADKHHKEEFEELGIESMIVPCLCGADEYANGKRLYSTPGQMLLIFRPGVGADACYNIRVE